MQVPTDANLVRRSAEGDPAAFVELAGRYRGSLAALIRRLVSSPEEAEDLLQEVLVQAWLSIGGLRDPERVQAWLLQMARNRCRDFHKSAERRESPTEARELEDHVNRYGRAAPREQPIAEVREALEGLPSAQREIIELFYLHGLTMKEISARTALPVGTVKSRLFTARHHLRSLLTNGKEEGK